MAAADERLLLARDPGFDLDALRRRRSAGAFLAAERLRRLDVERDVRRRFAFVIVNILRAFDADADRLLRRRLGGTASVAERARDPEREARRRGRAAWAPTERRRLRLLLVDVAAAATVSSRAFDVLRCRLLTAPDAATVAHRLAERLSAVERDLRSRDLATRTRDLPRRARDLAGCAVNLARRIRDLTRRRPDLAGRTRDLVTVRDRDRLLLSARDFEVAAPASLRLPALRRDRRARVKTAWA